LIQRDVDILKELASLDLVAVMISITTLQQELVRKMEPRTSAPHRRLETIEILAKNNIPVGVNAAPIIPGLNDVEIPAILKEASLRGARFAGHTIVRLPYAVKDLFVDWLNCAVPENASKILNRIRDVRDGELTNSDFGKRMTGEGEIADSIHQLFDASCKKYHLNEQRMTLSTQHFRRVSTGQMEIFFEGKNSRQKTDDRMQTKD
ncbi:MAG: radical SAM protein, partial [Ignavibacteriales bacterium]|nr:radical SAM protein [Ignavibacteriales bacterium]